MKNFPSQLMILISSLSLWSITVNIQRGNLVEVELIFHSDYALQSNIQVAIKIMRLIADQ